MPSQHMIFEAPRHAIIDIGSPCNGDRMSRCVPACLSAVRNAYVAAASSPRKTSKIRTHKPRASCNMRDPTRVICRVATLKAPSFRQTSNRSACKLNTLRAAQADCKASWVSFDIGCTCPRWARPRVGRRFTRCCGTCRRCSHHHSKDWVACEAKTLRRRNRSLPNTHRHGQAAGTELLCTNVGNKASGGNKMPSQHMMFEAPRHGIIDIGSVCNASCALVVIGCPLCVHAGLVAKRLKAWGPSLQSAGPGFSIQLGELCVSKRAHDLRFRLQGWAFHGPCQHKSKERTASASQLTRTLQVRPGSWKRASQHTILPRQLLWSV